MTTPVSKRNINRHDRFMPVPTFREDTMAMTIINADLNSFQKAPPQLTAAQRSTLRNALTRRLHHQRQHALHTSSALDDFSRHDSPGQRESVRDLGARVRLNVEKVEAALRRLDNGTYGLCQNCQRPIPIERLEVIPEVSNCVTCIGVREHIR